MDWVAYFEHNRLRRTSIPWERGITVEPRLRGPLIRSLQRFQVGEQGDGVHLRKGAAATGDRAYARAVAAFVAEEQAHARLLARLLGALGGTVIQWHWSDACFTLLRRLCGLRVELLVLLVAELIGMRYYRCLYERIPDPVLRAALGRILADEVAHVAFHCDYLRRALAPLGPLGRGLTRTTWRLFFRAVCLVVVLDQRSLLQALGVAPGELWRDCRFALDHATARIFGSAPLRQGAAVPRNAA